MVFASPAALSEAQQKTARPNLVRFRRAVEYLTAEGSRMPFAMLRVL